MPKKLVEAVEAWSLPAEYSYEKPWNGVPLEGDFLSVDTETEVISDLRRETPRCVLGSVSDGKRHCILTPEQLPAFLLRHRYRRFIFWNVGFDYRVIQKEVKGSIADNVLTEAVDDGRVHDGMLMEQLVRLAKGEGESMGDGKFFRMALDKAARKYDTPLKISKDNPYRMSFAKLWELQGGTLSGEKGYYDYAVADTIVLAQIWPILLDQALRFAREAGVSEEKIEKYGALTEQIQVKAAIALAQVSMNGAEFDVDAVNSAYNTTKFRYLRHLACMKKYHPELLKRYKKKNDGGFRTSKKTGAVQFELKLLRKLLEDFAREKGFDPPRSKGKGKLISASEKDWLPYRKELPVIGAWIGMKDAEQHLSFFSSFLEAIREGRTRIHGNYNVLVRTGRVSADDPNVTNFPKGDHFRDIIVAPKGKKLITIDMSFVELCTLAATCKDRYGESVLADVIDTHINSKGPDPHEYTAALLQGIPIYDFMGLKTSDPKKWKKDRQSAKACYSGDTELLTKQGWVDIRSLYSEQTMLGEGVEVAQYNPHTKDVSFVEPLAWIRNESSDLLEIDSTYMNQCVTPDHRMLLISKATGDAREALARDYEKELEECWLTVHGGYYRNEAGISSLTTRLSVMVQADGSFCHNQVKLGFSKARKIERCRSLLLEAGLSFGERTTDRVTTFTVRKGGWYVLTEDKHFLGWDVYDHEAFIDEVGKWDGCVTEKHAASFFNTSLVDVTVVQTILCLNGYKANLYTDKKVEDNHHDIYRVRWYVGDRKKNTEYARSNREQTTYSFQESAGPSYCVAVPSSWLMTRRKGKVSISGNCGFGLPGGLGPDKLSTYAKMNYGVTMSAKDAAAFKDKMLKEVYPEWEGYLGDSTLHDWSINLRVPLYILEEHCKNACWKIFHSSTSKLGMFCYCASKLMRGEGRSASTKEPYSPDFVSKLWELIDGVVNLADEATVERLKKLHRVGTLDGTLYDALYGRTAMTLTGRLRAHCSYTSACNAPFQGLAADGMKLAMYDLITRLGYKVCLMVHDELVVEVDENRAAEDAKVIERVLIENMEDVMDCLVPAACTYIISARWEKS